MSTSIRMGSVLEHRVRLAIAAVALLALLVGLRASGGTTRCAVVCPCAPTSTASSLPAAKRPSCCAGEDVDAASGGALATLPHGEAVAVGPCSANLSRLLGLAPIRVTPPRPATRGPPPRPCPRYLENRTLLL